MSKFKMKDQVSAVVKVGKLVTTFPKAADDKTALIQLLEKHGLGLANVVTFKTHQVLLEKQKGRAKAKY
jgi:hypothetical protein